MDRIKEIYLIIEELKNGGRYVATKGYYQHGNTTVYKHCVSVAIVSCRIAEALNLKVDRKALVRGALLHDYFLYDWHEKDSSHRFHGFRHAKIALENAKKDFNLNEMEKDIIVCHMFPLTLMPPRTKEAWVVCIADKWCAIIEILSAVKFKLKGNEKNVCRSLRSKFFLL